MKQTRNEEKNRRGFPLLISIILIFAVFGTVVFGVSRKITDKMSESAIQSLSESLDLIQCTIESILNSEARFQILIAQELSNVEDPTEQIRYLGKNQIMSKLSLILAGETEGVSNTGEPFTEEGLDFSAGGTVMGLPVSRSYLNYMGTWSYTIKSPVERDGQEIGTLYAEYVYDIIDESLPEGFYNQQATLYIMDAESERFVLKPKGMGKRSAGHLNLSDFYRANNIQNDEIRTEVEDCLETGRNAVFYHPIREVDALSYLWSVNGGTLFLVGYVPVNAIQQEGRAVNQSIIVVVASLLAAFLLCMILYYLNERHREKVRQELEEERRIHNQQLTEALQAAQIASESKTTFLSNMSHDIRTPMNAVLGFSTLLSRDAENPAKVREYTKKITASGQHLLSLINDILDVSKIESGKAVLNLGKFDLNDVIASADAIIQPMAKDKGQEFHLEVSGIRHEYLVGDETRINQILINLLSNAVKYTQEGGSIWLRIIGLKQHSNQYEHIRIEVEDNGYGMTPEYLETIFDAFSRAENSTTNKVQGTGLGMAITKSIVEMMGGTIDVFSQVDKGTLFRIDLELRVLEEAADRQFWEQWGIVRALTVGGSAENQESILALIQSTGVQMDTAADGDEALGLLRGGEDYQVVLMDWENCGPQAAKELRSALPDNAALVLLAEFDTEGMEETLRLRRTIDLTKPFFVSALQAKLQELLDEEDIPFVAEDADVLAGMHFLAAEDNEINGEILTALLEMEGADCEIMVNGMLAVERFRRSAPGEFDGILMDVQMPVMNGLEATRAIRALEREDSKEIPIIAMTANAFVEDEKAALDAGMNAHVPKPLNMELLKKAIRQFSRREERL